MTVAENQVPRAPIRQMLMSAKTKNGFVFSGLSPDSQLVEVIELEDHPFFMACQFHPEFKSRPHKPHPLFKAFLSASVSD